MVSGVKLTKHDKQKWQFDIIPKSWHKRRARRPEPTPISVAIPDFKRLDQSFCNMQVTFTDGSEKTFYSRVIYNALTDSWTVDGMHVSVKVIGHKA